MDSHARYRLDKELRDVINRNGVAAVLQALLRWYEMNECAAEATPDSIKFMMPEGYRATD